MYVHIYMYIVFNIFTRRFYLKLFNFKLGLLCFFPLPPVIFFSNPRFFRTTLLSRLGKQKTGCPPVLYVNCRRTMHWSTCCVHVRSSDGPMMGADNGGRREFGFLRVDFCTTGGYKLIGQYWTTVCFLARNDGLDFVFFNMWNEYLKL